MPKKLVKNFFSLIELLVVIAIIAILAAMLMPGLSKARNRVKETACFNNLRQMSIQIQSYYEDYDKKMTPWLSTLCPDYLDNPSVFHCLSDGNAKNTPRTQWSSHMHGGDFLNAYDREGNTGYYGINPNYTRAEKISYFYEFCHAPTLPPTTTIWGWTEPSWCDQKMIEMKQYSYRIATFPIVRCTWHYKEKFDAPYFNASFTGNVFYSMAKWENGVWTP